MIKYERIITDEEQKILEHDLLDVTDWIDKAIIGKVNNCMTRAARQYQEQLKTDPNALVPVNEKTCATLLFASKDYKNRVAREKTDGTN